MGGKRGNTKNCNNKLLLSMSDSNFFANSNGKNGQLVESGQQPKCQKYSAKKSFQKSYHDQNMYQ